MDDRVIQFRVGVLVVATIIITAILIVLFGESPRLIQGQKTVYIRFPSAPGVTVDTPVRKSGILIGRVSDVELRRDGGVLVTARIDGRRAVREDEVCRISADNFFGDAMLEFVPSGVEGASTREISDGEYLDGVVARDPMDVLQVVVNLEGDMVRALGSIQVAGEEVGQVARNLNVLVVNNQDQFNRILGKTEQALERFETAMDAVNQILGDEDLTLALREALEDVPELLDEAGGLLAGLRRVASEAEENLANLRGLTGPLGQQGGEIVGKLDQGAERLDELLQQLVQFSRSLNSSEGSLGQFVNNPELYQKLSSAATNIEQVSRRLEPIVDDARHFMDKVARDPRLLGVRGALDRGRSGIK
jgi:phospholipid/cholesterol/gamma-HCH transport system substrate-binding protein